MLGVSFGKTASGGDALEVGGKQIPVALLAVVGAMLAAFLVYRAKKKASNVVAVGNTNPLAASTSPTYDPLTGTYSYGGTATSDPALQGYSSADAAYQSVESELLALSSQLNALPTAPSQSPPATTTPGTTTSTPGTSGSTSPGAGIDTAKLQGLAAKHPGATVGANGGINNIHGTWTQADELAAYAAMHGGAAPPAVDPSAAQGYYSVNFQRADGSIGNTYVPMGMPASAYIPSNATLLSGGAPSATSIHPIGGIAANTPAQPAYHGAAA